jgi:hypothetical protein
MWLRSSSKFLSLPVVCVLLMSGCSAGPNFIAKHEPWREKEERACLASGAVRETSFIHSRRSALGGPSVCGAERPFEMSAAAQGRVSLRPPALLRCPMIPQVERWVRDVVEPAALHNFGVPLSEMTVAASYGCRAMNNIPGGRLSEHGHANAIDISAFTLADGRKIKVLTGWNGDARERAFLRAVRSGACNEFTTVLGPGADRFHADHLHMDLARHGHDGLRRICK